MCLCVRVCFDVDLVRMYVYAHTCVYRCVVIDMHAYLDTIENIYCTSHHPLPLNTLHHHTNPGTTRCRSHPQQKDVSGAQHRQRPADVGNGAPETAYQRYRCGYTACEGVVYSVVVCGACVMSNYIHFCCVSHNHAPLTHPPHIQIHTHTHTLQQPTTPNCAPTDPSL
jgi:hypothetical protein